MAQNDNVVFKTSTTATIDDLFSWNKSTGQIAAKTDNIPIVPGTVYFTADGHIVHDLAQNNRLWMSKNAYSAIYAEDVAETNTDIANAIKYSIHYVEGPTTDTTPGTWTGTINGITELYNGLTIIYVPAVAGGSSTTTLNINGLGAKTCYYSNTSAITTHYSVGTPILLTYRNNCWRRADYNSNTTYSAMSVAEMRAGTATSERSIRADYLKTFLSTLGGTNLTLTHSNSAPYLQLNHDPSGITAGTYGNNSQQNPSYGGTFNIPYFTVDTQGHITNASVTTVKIPESDNTDYKVRQTSINSNDNNNYRILLSNSANDTSEDSVSKKNANLIYNPTENKLSTGNIKLTGELDVTGNVYLRNQTTVDNLTAGSLIINGNSTFNNDINLAQGAVKWTSNSLPSVTSADYFLVIDAFANGGATKHITKANAIKSLISSSAIGSSTKPVYWTGSAFSAITSYSGAAALTGTPTAPTATAGTSTTQIATTEFVTNAVAQGFIANDAMVFKGLIGSNQPITQLPTSGYNAGWTYRVANAGIFAGEYCEVGDLLIAINDGPASGSSVINTDWGKVEHNIDGAVFRGSGASNSSVGSSTQPVYVNGSGIVTAITGAIANDTTGNAATATALATGRTLKVNLASTSASTAFNGAANITDIGVSGILPVGQGGTGQDNTDNFVKVYSRDEMGNSINYDNPGVNGLFEARKSSEITATGEWPGGVENWFPLLSLKTSSVIMQIAGNSQYGYGWWIRGRQGANATLAGIAWEQLVTNNGTWDINITGTATTASKLSNTSKIGDTNKPVYFKADGTPAVINYTIDKSVPSNAVFTDRYVNNVAFIDDSANTAASPVKMTLTRAGSDTVTVTANIPKVSSSSAGVVPKGTTVSSQSQSTKFLREDGTWAAPSYTVNTNTDTLVKQTAKSDNKNYKILFTKSDSPTSGNASEAAYDTAITINPSTHTLTAVNLKGILSTQDLRRPTGLRGLNDVTLQPLVSVVRANRLAFLPADQIIIEKTTDGGATWVDAGISDASKLGLFSETRPVISLPMINGERNILCGLRVTFTAMKYNVPAGTPETEKYNYWNSTYYKSTERYCNLKELYFWLTSLSDSIGVTVQRATGANPNSWSTIFNDSSFYMTGWSGCNYVSFSQHIFGGLANQTGYPWNYRITFMTKGVDGTNTMATSSTTTPQNIMEIRGYGDSYWAASNSYMARDHIYSFDAHQNTTFPANVSATKFIGPLEGNANTATEFSSNTTVKLTGDATGESAGSKKGWSVPVTLANSGVAAGSYGPSANAEPGYGATFNVPYITVDAKGRVTSASTKTIKIPASDEQDHRDEGYGKITPAGDTGTSAVTANTTQITAKSYNEGFTFKTGNKWLTIAGTESGTTGSDILTIGHKAGLTAKNSYGSTATTASANNGTIKVTDVQYDEAGHVTASTDRTITLSQVKNTAGATNSTAKLFLIGATTQGENPQTYSNNGIYIGNNNKQIVIESTSDASIKIRKFNESDNTDVATISMYVDLSGQKGLYDGKNQKWIFANTSDGMNSFVSSNFRPSETEKYSLGAPDRYWNTLYVKNLQVPSSTSTGRIEAALPIKVTHINNREREFEIVNDNSSIDFALMIGLGNVNYGLYDYKKGTNGSWILSTSSTDSNHDWTFNGNAATATKAEQDENGLNIINNYFKERGGILEGTDLSAYTIVGSYLNTTGNNSNNSNTGFEHGYGYLISMGKRNNTYQGIQFEINSSGASIYYRTHWGNWKTKYQILTTANTITVAQGGTGATSFIANSIIMSGSTTTSALTTRAVTNNTSDTMASASTNIPTMNTLYYTLAKINNADQTHATTIYAPTEGGTANTQALIGNGATTAPKWVNISPSISITEGTSNAAPKVNVTVLGQSGTMAQSITTASTFVYGVTKLNSATNNTSETEAATPKAVKSAYDLADNHKYWANIEATLSASYNKTPEVAKIKLNGNTSATAASIKNVQLVYDASLETLNFVFS